MNDPQAYTFGDTDLAAERLHWLAIAYEPATRELLGRWGGSAPAHALDLGSGPGHTTRLLHETLAAVRTTGIDSSSRFVAEAQRTAPSGVSFVIADLLRPPFAVDPGDLLFCRHLVAHVAEPGGAFCAWTQLARPGARLIVQETETIGSDHPTLARYYECVAAMQARHGQRLRIGAHLEAALAATPWQIEHSAVRALTLEPRLMARIHVMNLRTWRHGLAASALFEPAALDDLDLRLSAIAQGTTSYAPVVHNELREIVVRLPASR
jgi:trans-aconitate 2-methyltransferase